MLPCSSKLKLQPAVLSPKDLLPLYMPTSPFLSSSLSCICALFHFPYPVSPLFATLTKTARVCTNNSQSGTLRARAGEPGPAEILPSSTSISVNSVFSVDSLLIPASPHSPQFTDHRPLSPIPFLFRFLRTLLRSRKTQLFCFQAIPNSLPKTP